MASSDHLSGSRRWKRRRPNSPSPGRPRSGPIPKFEVEGKPPRPSASPSKCNSVRLYLVWSVLFVGIVGLCVNLFRLQISRGPFLKQKAEYQQQQHSLPFIPRRPITDRNGSILAIDRQVYTLYAHPILFKAPPEEIAEKLAAVLVREDLSSPSSAELLDLFESSESGIELADPVTEEVGDRILELRIDGLELIRRPHRLYPQESLGSDVVGYVDDEGKGQAGIEHSQENLLKRTMPSLLFQRAVNGAWVPAQLATGFVQMDDLELRLTIDSRLQRIAQTALAEQVEAYNAERGTAIVMDARDGSILTLVNEPSYDPNQYYRFDPKLFKNWALTDLYEPGSTFKPINVALALEAGAIAPDTLIYDEGRIQMGEWSISNADWSSVGARGTVSITDIVKYSSNIGMVRVMQRMDPQVYYEGLQRLGLGKALDIDLPFVATGVLKSSEQFVNIPIEVATSSFGQGFSITPLQLAQINASLANGGKLISPHVVEGLFNSEGQLYWQMSRPEPKQVFSPETTKIVLEMMETVVADGTGKNAQIPGYRIAGKTGTAEKASASGGYYQGSYITSFVGIIPVDEPRYVIVAVVDEPEGGSGGLVAAPIVKSIAEGLITLEKILPSRPPDRPN